MLLIVSSLAYEKSAAGVDSGIFACLLHVGVHGKLCIVMTFNLHSRGMISEF